MQEPTVPEGTKGRIVAKLQATTPIVLWVETGHSQDELP